jgi:hypothetical protein
MLAACRHGALVAHGIGTASLGDPTWLVPGLSVVREQASAASLLDECVGCSVGLLDLIFGSGSVTVARLRF